MEFDVVIIMDTEDNDMARKILDKFTNEMIHEVIKKMFVDGVLTEIDLDFSYFDASNIKVKIPIVHFKNKKPGEIVKKLFVTISLDISEEEKEPNI